jgi:hypothetical protein
MRVLVIAVAVLGAVTSASRVQAQTIADDLRNDEEVRTVPVARLALGPVVAFAPEVHPELALDATIGASALQGIVGGFALNVEGGYTFESGHEDDALHAANVTVGLGYGALGSAVTFQPRLILGSWGGDLAIGMRNGVALHLAGDVVSAEIAHQFLKGDFSSGGDGAYPFRHDVRLMLGLNPAALVYGIVLLNDAAY